MTMLPFTTAEQLREFMFAGKAKLTIKSERTGKHYTYKIRRSPDTDSLWFVHRLSGESNYIYLGTIYPDDRMFQPTRKTAAIYKTCPSFKGFEWLYRRLTDDKAIPPGVSINHEGRCGMCGRELTDPVSVAEGYGPECRSKRLRRGMMSDRKTS